MINLDEENTEIDEIDEEEDLGDMGDWDAMLQELSLIHI